MYSLTNIYKILYLTVYDLSIYMTSCMYVHIFTVYLPVMLPGGQPARPGPWQQDAQPLGAGG